MYIVLPIANNGDRRPSGQRILQEKEPNYKQMAYLDARSYSEIAH